MRPIPVHLGLTPGLAVGLALGLATTGAVAQDSTPDPTHGEGDPWCDTLEAGVGMVDCALPAGDLILFFDFEEGGDSGTLMTVEQSTPEGGSRVTSDPIEIWDVAQPPALRDINGDDVEELFLPVGAGMVNVQFQVWQADESGVYSFAGSLDGFSPEGFVLTADGLIVGTVRDNAATYIETAYRLGDGGLVPVYDLTVDFYNQTCTFVDPDSVAGAGLDPEPILAACLDREWE